MRTHEGNEKSILKLHFFPPRYIEILNYNFAATKIFPQTLSESTPPRKLRFLFSFYSFCLCFGEKKSVFLFPVVRLYCCVLQEWVNSGDGEKRRGYFLRRKKENANRSRVYIFGNFITFFLVGEGLGFKQGRVGRRQLFLVLSIFNFAHIRGRKREPLRISQTFNKAQVTDGGGGAMTNNPDSPSFRTSKMVG